ncbi:MAG: B12-binding domain-containing radical SAM protein [Candidatus Omnitrophica bacterium]|nr:B12-binding domain-containing radical SAM protein [Candidatus Omnitrophota bacterium]
MKENIKKIVLINPPWIFAHEREIVLSQNLGLGYLTAYLLKHGHQVEIIDALCEGINNYQKIKSNDQPFLQVGLDYQQIVKRIPLDTDFIGISAPFTNNAKIVKQLAHVIKESFPEIPIIMGGVYPSLTPYDAFCEKIEYYVIGEGEKALLDLVNGQEPNQIKGVLCFGKSKGFEAGQIIENLDQLPFPARDKLPMSKYVNFHSPRRLQLKTGSIITSRGCPFDCTFCSIHRITGYKWRMRSAENVLAEIRELVEKYGVEHIEFEDDNLTLDKQRALAIFEGLIKINKELKPLSWSTPNAVRIDTLDRDLLEKIKQSNCLSLNFAIESGDPELLKKMNKKLDLNTVLEMTRLCKALNIKMNAFFMIGYPGEDQASFQKTLSFIKEIKIIGVDNVYTTITRAYPGTKLYEFCEKNNYITIKDKQINTYLGNAITPENLIVTPDFDKKVLLKRLALVEKAVYPWYLRFYHRYAYLIKKIIPINMIKYIKKLIDEK